ncbi:MAG: sterol desaturase family protein, partial [Cyanobium sp.]
SSSLPRRPIARAPWHQNQRWTGGEKGEKGLQWGDGRSQVMQLHSTIVWGLTFLTIILGRYFLMAGLAYWWLYVHRPAERTVRRPSAQAIATDIRLSVHSAAVFAVASAAVLHLQALGYTRLYSAPDQHGLWYLGISYGLVLILQDGFFYATHRLSHYPALFPWMHRGHHRSGQPTPWTSFAFDLPEALLQALFLVLIVMVVPLHPITLLAVLTTMTVWAIVNHLGLDHLPRWFPHHWFGRWLIGPAHHSLHHRHGDRHFGLYFTFWDRVLATEDSRYGATLSPFPGPGVLPVPPGGSILDGGAPAAVAGVPIPQGPGPRPQ